MMGYVSLCRHQGYYYNRESSFDAGRHKDLILYFLESQFNMVQVNLDVTSACRLLRQLQECASWENKLPSIIDQAIGDPGRGVFDFCDVCRTDFIVHASSNGVMITAWQDLGKECSPLDPGWAGQRIGTAPGARPPFGDPEPVLHVPGSVRRLYEGSEWLNG
jgi:hypothetical protein